MLEIVSTAEGLVFAVRVQPRASRDEVSGVIEGAMKDHCHKTNPRIASAGEYREMLAASM